MEEASGLGVCVLGTAGRRDPATGEHLPLSSCPLTSHSCCRNRRQQPRPWRSYCRAPGVVLISCRVSGFSPSVLPPSLGVTAGVWLLLPRGVR